MVEDFIGDKKVKYKQFIEKIGRYTITHNVPILTDEERKEKDKEIITKMINGLSNLSNHQN